MATESAVAEGLPTTRLFDVDAIRAMLPHRGDNLLMDAAQVEGNRVEGWYQVTGKECFLKGHFPGNPVFPGVMLLEFAAQACGVLLAQLFPELLGNGNIGMLVRTDQVKWGRLIRPSDVLKVNATFDRKKGDGFRFVDVTVLVNSGEKPALTCVKLFLAVGAPDDSQGE